MFSRVGAQVAAGPVETARVPPGVDLSDGLEEDEAAALALYNHPQFEAALAQLDVSLANLVAAGLLKNPVLSLLFPWGPKQFEGTLNVAVDALWLRADREAVARHDLEALAEALVVDGLALVRDARLAFLDAELAERRAEIEAQQAERAGRQFELVDFQIAAGELPQAERWTAAAERDRLALNASEARMKSAAALLVLCERLAGGFGLQSSSLKIVELDAPVPLPDCDRLKRDALASRPDLRAAEQSVEAAARRVDLSRKEWAAVSVILDANGDGTEGFEAGPGLVLELPVFDRGQGRRALADAGLVAAIARLRAMRQKVLAEVDQRALEVQQASELVDRTRQGSLEGLEHRLAAVRVQRAVGDATEIEVLAAESALASETLQLRIRETARRRALAELEFVVGRRYFHSREET